MSERDPWVRVRHMRDYATEALELAEGRVREDLQTDRILRYALVHLVELVGEAAAHVDEAIRERAPGIPWSRIVSTRNRLPTATTTLTMRPCGTSLSENCRP